MKTYKKAYAISDVIFYTAKIPFSFLQYNDIIDYKSNVCSRQEHIFLHQ